MFLENQIYNLNVSYISVRITSSVLCNVCYGSIMRISDIVNFTALIRIFREAASVFFMHTMDLDIYICEKAKNIERKLSSQEIPHTYVCICFYI